MKKVNQCWLTAPIFCVYYTVFVAFILVQVMYISVMTLCLYLRVMTGTLFFMFDPIWFQ